MAVKAGVSLAAFLLRWAVSLHGYSGMRTPPRFGDYEAQRHWMEVTVNLPAVDWYRNSSQNDLSYWGLDYPPLSGYQSWLCGKYVQCFEPTAVQLATSRGYESPSSKRLLRQTVLAADALVALPAAHVAALVLAGTDHASRCLLLLVALLFNPATVLIDHGHFQYNCIGLGLAAAAIAAAVAGRSLLSALLFSLSLNHKQMGLYYAPAFFAFLLGQCLQRPTLTQQAVNVAALGGTVIVTFGVVWAPWLQSQSAWFGVLRRVFPTQRGLYEDYVANWWCASSRLIKWTNLLPPARLVQLCAATTLIAAAPALASQVLRPTSRGFLLCLANSAMAFFLFSYQVHEKSILLPLLPLGLLLGTDQPELLCWVNTVAVFSMAPLLLKDGLGLAAVGTLATANAAVLLASTWPAAGQQQRFVSALPAAWQGMLMRVSLTGCAAILGASAALNPPHSLPFLYDALIVTWSFLHFAGLFAFTCWLQLQEYHRASGNKPKQL